MSEMMNYLISHKQFAYGLAAGWVLRNPKAVIDLVFTLLEKIPGFGTWLKDHQGDAIAWLRGAEQEAEAKINEDAK